ncbi:tyrosine-type recombinase/integrase [Desulforudis sp. 1190]|uniref:tyrosine-type recombinase/integrase n=1 Tax=Desulforudis sp. 1190 TaxID=3416136 RepID=UPI003CF86B60
MPVLLALTTGMRLGEILGLRWQDVDLKKGRLTVYHPAPECGRSPSRQRKKRPGCWRPPGNTPTWACPFSWR